MKAYKIPVPVADVIHGEHQTITRQEIHELVRGHAEKLGWDCGDKDAWHYESSIIELDQFGDIWFYNTNVDTVITDIKNVKGVEISPFEFLKLTPKDVKGLPDTKQIVTSENDNTLHNSNRQALLDAFTAGWDAAHNNRFSIGVNFDKWYNEKAGNK